MFEIPKIPPAPKFNEMKFADLSAADIKAMSDDDLQKLLTGDSDIEGVIPISVQMAISNELTQRAIRQSARPHWSTIPMLMVTVIAAAGSWIAAIPVVQQFSSDEPPSQASQSAPTSASFQSAASSSSPQLDSKQP